MAYIDDIFRRYKENSCTEEELEILLRYFEEEKNISQLQLLIDEELGDARSEVDIVPELTAIVARNRAVIWAVPEEGRVRASRKITMTRRWIAIAASLTLVIGLSTWFYYKKNSVDYQETELLADIAPGTNRATLTLSDGRSVILKEDQEILQTNAGGATYADGTIVLEASLVQMATVATPRAGQYQVRLPDGSKVWLNAASSIRYPTRFEGDIRRVELQGEAYFEVDKSPIPFVVVTAGQEITVLGTHFNVMAYADEAYTQTTLAEGKVRVSSTRGETQELLPGSQATLDTKGLHVQQVNVEDYTAWKDGVIVLEKQSLLQVLRQLERWYDVEIVIDPHVKLPSATLSGDVLRDLPLTALLETLSQQTGLHFERRERRVMVKDN